jgi:uncharacterized protein
MQTVLITGGTGLIGTALTNLLTQKGYNVIILTRTKEPQTTNHQPQTVSYATWDVTNQTLDINALKSADHIIHLAGAGVGDKRWTKKRKQEIVDSRTKSAALLVKALEENENKVKTVISASAIGWYGQDNPASLQRGGFREADPAAEGFLGETCRLWEQSIEPVTKMGKRLVKLRTGIVLDKNEGAIREFKKPLRSGIATILGNGKQVISWIHIDDIARLYLHALENENMQGTYNAVSHQPVSNKTLVLQLARRVRGKFYMSMHVPSFILKMVIGEMSIEVLKSATVNNEKVRQAGFKFLYPSLESALNQL